MKTIIANRFQKALAEIEKLDKEQALKLNEEIKFENRNHYHVAMVKITDRPGEAKNEVSVTVQMFNDHGFKKIEKNFKFLGWTKLAILHDPTLNEKEETKELVKGSDKVLTEQEIEAEIERRAEEKANARIKKIQEKAKLDETKSNEKNEGGINVPNPFENGDTVEVMKEFAKNNDIDLSGLRIKDEIKAVLTTWYNDQVNEQK